MIDTQKKLTRWSKQFLDVMGDMEIAEVKPKHGYDYITAILKKHPTRSNQTLKDYAWGVQSLLKYCVQRGYIDVNPFQSLDLSKYGEQSEKTYPYSREELNAIFLMIGSHRSACYYLFLQPQACGPQRLGT